MREVHAALDAVYDAVKDDEKYKPQDFRAALVRLRSALKGVG
jgi:hypothetical protein